jgi:hypothetical protein
MYFVWIAKSTCNVCCPIKPTNKQTSEPDSNTDHYQSWMLPTTDAKITLDTGSVMRISCPGFGFQHGDLSASQFWTTKYVIPPKTQFQCNIVVNFPKTSWLSSYSLLQRHEFLTYSRVHISSDEVFSKILKKPFIVQKKNDTSYESLWSF